METLDRNYKIELKRIPNNDGSIVKFSFDKLVIEKDDESDFFTVSSLVKMIEKIINRKFNIKGFLQTYKFYLQLTLIDNEIDKYNFVYLRILDEENKICKIGRTYNIKRRYTKREQEDLEFLIPVKDDEKVEALLIKAFKENFEIVDKTNETFIYTSLKTVKSLFTSTCEPYKVKASYRDSKHIQSRYIDKKHRHKALFVSLPVCEIVFNNYVNDSKYIEKFNTMKKYIIDSIHKDVYISNEYNEMMKTKCTYWKFHKYTIIQNDNDLYINGSRLWNSILKQDNIKKNISFAKFLKLKSIQKIQNQFTKMYPNQKLYRENVTNTKQPYYSGIYVHYILIHFIVSYLNADYALMVSELMYRQYYNTFLQKATGQTMKGGHVVLSLDEYNERYIKYYRHIKDLDAFVNAMGLSII